jgi:hypothetical protein
MRDNGNEVLLGTFRYETLSLLLLRNDQDAQTVPDSHLATDNFQRVPSRISSLGRELTRRLRPPWTGPALVMALRAR